MDYQEYIAKNGKSYFLKPELLFQEKVEELGMYFEVEHEDKLFRPKILLSLYGGTHWQLSKGQRIDVLAVLGSLIIKNEIEKKTDLETFSYVFDEKTVPMGYTPENMRTDLLQELRFRNPAVNN